MHNKIICSLLLISFCAHAAPKRKVASEPGLESCYAIPVSGQKDLEELVLQTQKSLKGQNLTIYLNASSSNESWFKDFQCTRPDQGAYTCRGDDDAGTFTFLRTAKTVELGVKSLTFGEPGRAGPSFGAGTLKGTAFDCNGGE